MKNSIKISAVAQTDPVSAWEAYTNPQYIVQWNFASPDWCCPWAVVDLELGGKYTSRMEARDGSFGFDFEATIERVEPGKLLVYRLSDGRRVETTFEVVTEGTRITTRFEAEDVNPHDLQRDGWQAILNNLAKVSESVSD